MGKCEIVACLAIDWTLGLVQNSFIQVELKYRLPKRQATILILVEPGIGCLNSAHHNVLLHIMCCLQFSFIGFTRHTIHPSFLFQSPMSVVLCNQIGNFWRIRGNTYHSIECFRKALAHSPNNADVLLNLARVLFNLNFLQDAIYLTRQSLEMQASDHNCWLQHFTLGEILKSNGNLEEAGVHFRQALELNPTFHPAEVHLRDIGLPSPSPTNTYTFLVIGFLVVIVLAVVYFMALASDNRPSKCSKVSVWGDSKKPKKRLSTWDFVHCLSRVG